MEHVLILCYIEVCAVAMCHGSSDDKLGPLATLLCKRFQSLVLPECVLRPCTFCLVHGIDDYGQHISISLP